MFLYLHIFYIILQDLLLYTVFDKELFGQNAAYDFGKTRQKALNIDVLLFVQVCKTIGSFLSAYSDVYILPYFIGRKQ